MFCLKRRLLSAMRYVEPYELMSDSNTKQTKPLPCLELEHALHDLKIK